MPRPAKLKPEAFWLRANIHKCFNELLDDNSENASRALYDTFECQISAAYDAKRFDLDTAEYLFDFLEGRCVELLAAFRSNQPRR